MTNITVSGYGHLGTLSKMVTIEEGKEEEGYVKLKRILHEFILPDKKPEVKAKCKKGKPDPSIRTELRNDGK